MGLFDFFKETNAPLMFCKKSDSQFKDLKINYFKTSDVGHNHISF
jgi:hypothetical protein